MIESQVRQTMLRYRLLDSNTRRVGVAVSGGADSVCLFLLLRQWHDVAIIHVNHLLRGGESDADEAFVRALAKRFDVPVHVRRADVQALGGNLEEEARQARYAFCRELIASGEVDCVATGHTLNDQAETVLFRLMRGAHLAGLAAIHPVAPGPIIRPLIEVMRSEVEQHLKDAGEPWREDSSNRDPAYDRNRIRHALLPQLKRDWNPEIERMLAQLATLSFDEERFWEGWMNQNARAHLNIRGNIVLASASNLVEQPTAVARRLVRRAIEAVRGDLHSIDFAHVEAILDLASRADGTGRLQLPLVDVFRSFDWLRFAPISTGSQLTDRNLETPCSVPGKAGFSSAGISLSLEVVETNDVSALDGGPVENARVEKYELDWDLVRQFGLELRLRTWKPGDQYRPAGEGPGQPRKVKAMFQEARIPLWERGTWPIMTVGSQIIWTRQFGPAVEVEARRDSIRLLRVSETREKN